MQSQMAALCSKQCHLKAKDGTYREVTLYVQFVTNIGDINRNITKIKLATTVIHTVVTFKPIYRKVRQPNRSTKIRNVTKEQFLAGSLRLI